MKKPKHYHERNRIIIISYFKMHMGYLTPQDRWHDTTQMFWVQGQETASY